MTQATPPYTGINTDVLPNFPRGKIAFFVTNNIYKFHEARIVLSEFKIATAMLRIKTIEIQDDSLQNIVKAKAVDATRNCSLPLLVEDAGLFIEALNGFPGPYSSYVYRTIGTRGVLKLMESVEKRDAYFQSVVAFSSPEEVLKCFHGKVKGKISREELGSSGFGFDPIFEASGCGKKTFAEMTTNEKNEYSHRAEALRKFANWYTDNFKRRF